MDLFSICLFFLKVFTFFVSNCYISRGGFGVKLDAYEEYLFQVSNELIKFLVKNGASIQDAQDIVQESIVKLLKIDNVIPAEKIKSWLYQVSINLYYNLYNRRKKYNEIINRYFTSNFDFEEPEMDYSILYTSLTRLASKDRELLLLKYEQNLTIKEISVILNRPEQSLKTELYRARKRLSKIYLESEDNENGI